MKVLTNSQIEAAQGLYHDLAVEGSKCTDDHKAHGLMCSMIAVEQVLALLGINTGMEVTQAAIKEYEKQTATA